MRLQYDVSWLRRVTDPKAFGRVAVLMGGDSSERDISLMSGNSVCEALNHRGVDVHPFDPRDRDLSQLVEERFDRVGSRCTAPAVRMAPCRAPSTSRCALHRQRRDGLRHWHG